MWCIYLSENVVQTRRVELSWLTLSSLRAFSEAVFLTTPLPHDVRMRTPSREGGWLSAITESIISDRVFLGHCQLCVHAGQTHLP